MLTISNPVQMTRDFKQPARFLPGWPFCNPFVMNVHHPTMFFMTGLEHVIQFTEQQYASISIF